MDIFAATEILPIHQHSNMKSSRRESVDSGVSFSPSSMVCDSGIGLSTSGTEIREQQRSRKRNKKKKRLATTLSAASFNDLYTLKGEELGHGSYGRVESCVNIYTGLEYAVKIIDKDSWAFQRQKMLKEIELYYLCQGHDSIIQLIEYFEDQDHFYLIFEKAQGGHLLRQINNKIKFSEIHAAKIIAKLAKALKYLHSKGIAHRDLKPENVLCMEDGEAGQVASSIRLCDFDLCSNVQPTVTTPRLQSPVGSAEYMAPEVVDAFIHDDDLMYDLVDDDLEDFTYDKSCDLWSLGVIGYTLLCGFLPFNGCCGEDCGWSDRDMNCKRCEEDLFNSIKRGSLNFPEPYWSKISKDAKDLLSKLLAKNPNQRMEAADILDHPWIMKMTKSNNAEIQDNPVSQQLKSQLKLKSQNIPIPMSPNVLRKAMSTHLWSSPTTTNNMSQNMGHLQSKIQNPCPGIKAVAKMRRQSSVVEFCLQHEDYLSRCEY